MKLEREPRHGQPDLLPLLCGFVTFCFDCVGDLGSGFSSLLFLLLSFFLLALTFRYLLRCQIVIVDRRLRDDGCPRVSCYVVAAAVSCVVRSMRCASV